MNGVIIHNSKYGATRDYAQWLSEELSLPLFRTENKTQNEIRNADFILIGTSVYFGKFKIQKWLKENVPVLKSKKVFLFIVCGTGADEKNQQNKIIQDNLLPDLKQQCEIYFLPGRVIHEELTWMHKMALSIAGRFEKDPKKKDAMHKDIDGVRKENLLPLINAINNYGLRITGKSLK